VPAVANHLIEINRCYDARERLTDIKEQATDPADFASNPDKFEIALMGINLVLGQYRLELCNHGGRVRFCCWAGARLLPTNLPKAEVVKFDTITRDLSRP
jgi:hypothetical protein